MLWPCTGFLPPELNRWAFSSHYSAAGKALRSRPENVVGNMVSSTSPYDLHHDRAVKACRVKCVLPSDCKRSLGVAAFLMERTVKWFLLVFQVEHFLSMCKSIAYDMILLIRLGLVFWFHSVQQF